MKQLKGIASSNINKVLIGRVTFKKNIFKKKNNLIFISDNGASSKYFLATITPSASDIDNSLKFVNNVKGVFELHEGDIVTIEPDGNINVVYDIKSHHNAILV